ncbi:MAG TPA: two-component regulator propeller domain-containing protein, partial [Candidatus Paceibacterota bacterium]|nr:two-component regulator propeller domain-containing protein [Candidatus Paceibacterota bacterium]
MAEPSMTADQRRIPTNSGKPDISFARITVTDGLSHADMRCIVQDHQGFMWFGSWLDGLHRFDGGSFKAYRHEATNPGSIGFDSVYLVFEDRQRMLWVGTLGGGLDRYDRETDTFIHYRLRAGDSNSLPNDSVRALSEDRNGTLWVVTDGGLSRMDRSKEIFISYRFGSTNSTAGNSARLRAICMDRQTGLFWVGSRNDGVYVFDPVKETSVHLGSNPDDPTSLSDNTVNFIYQDRKGDLWICTEHGLNRWNPETKGFTRYQFDSFNPGGLGNDFVSAVLEDRAGRFWVGTGNGLDLFDRSRGVFFHYRHDPFDPTSLSGNFINIGGLYEDRTGNLWIATRDGGISRLGNEGGKFATYRANRNSPQTNSLSQNTVTAFCCDHAGNLWIGTANGLDRFDGRNFTHYFNEPGNSNSLSPGPVWALAESPDHQLWVGVNGGGICRFDGTNFTRYRHDPTDPRSLGGDFMYGLQPDRHGGVWISVNNGGLDHFDGQRFTHFRPDKNDTNSLPELYVGTLFIDRNDCVWMGSAAMGLIQFDPAKRKATSYLLDPEHPHSKVGNWVRDINGDGDTIWVAAYSGLFSFDLNSKKFIRCYTEQDGIANRSVLSVQPDADGNVWASTLAGISRLDVQTGTFRNFDAADGLHAADFCERSRTRMPDGRLCFGGVNGFNLIDPRKLPSNSIPPTVVLTDFQLFNKPVAIGKNSPLQKAIHVADHVTLSHDQQVFRVKFAALNYTAPQKNRFAYKLEGFDSDWRYTDAGDRSASYTRLDPGEYSFRVKASNNDGVWNEDGVRLGITVTPAWWQTRWFRGGIGLMILATVTGAYQLRVRSLHRRSRDLERQMAERKASQETIGQLNERLRMLAEATFEGICISEDGRILDVNDRYCAMWGYERDELLGREIISILAPENRPAMRERIATDDVTLTVHRGMRKDGGHFYFEVQGKMLNVGGHKLRVAALRDITERKRMEEALRESELRIRRKLDSILAPDFDLNALELSDVIDCEKIQALMREYNKVTNVAIGIADVHGKILVAAGWQDICTKFHRANQESCKLCVESNAKHTRGVPDNTFKLYQCNNSMWETATPITIGGRHMGNLFLGQFFFDDETPDHNAFRQQARRFGYDEAEYLSALACVPRLSRKHVEASMAFHTALAAMIGNLSFGNLKLANALEERKRTQENLALLNFALNRVGEAAYLIDETGRFVYVNLESCDALGYSSAELLGMTVADIDFGLAPQSWDEYWQNLKNRKSITVEATHRRKNGST